MTVRYSSARAKAAGSTGCVPYRRQARAVDLRPRIASNERFCGGAAGGCTLCLYRQAMSFMKHLLNRTCVCAAKEAHGCDSANDGYTRHIFSGAEGPITVLRIAARDNTCLQ